MLQIPKQSKYQPYSVCLQSLKQLPSLFSNILDSSQLKCKDELKKVIKCSNTFILLVAKQNQQVSFNTQIFNRFFSRLKQINYSLLAATFAKQKARMKNPQEYFVEKQEKLFQICRQVFTKINRSVQKYHSQTNIRPILEQLANIISEKGMQIAQLKQLNIDHIQQLKSQCLQVINILPKNQLNHILTYSHYRNSFKMQKKNSLKHQQNNSILKKCGLDILGNIQQLYFQQMPQQSEDNLVKEALHRNRFISNIMKKYAQKYTNWNKKPDHKKNRISVEYRPTVYIPQTPQKAKSQRKNIRNNKYQTLFKTNITNFKGKNDQATLQPQQTKSKQQIIDYICAHRQKYCLKKVIVLGNNLQVGPKDMILLPRKENNNSKNSKYQKKAVAKKSNSFRVESAQPTKRDQHLKNASLKKQIHQGFYRNSKGHSSYNTVTLMNKSFI